MSTTLTSLKVRQIDALKRLGNSDKEVCFGVEYNKYKVIQHLKVVKLLNKFPAKIIKKYKSSDIDF